MSDYNFRYRPQTINELNLTAVKEDLIKVLKSVQVPHAFLFAGPRGTGKTSAARIIAKAVNCLNKKKDEVEPCNQCEQCLSITAGNNLDILEIDAASNRGIDDIRELREKVKLAPTKAAYKVYIIDEVHMLTTEAFNALLKTLEEPPKHAIFILCTTEVEKLPATIVSRCLRINFKKAKAEEITAKLKKIAEKEKLEINDGSLAVIAKSAAGSFRDALRILEHASFESGKITEERIKEILGQTVGMEPEKLLILLAAKNTRESLMEVSRVVNAGANLRIYTEQILELLRGRLLGELGLPSEEAGAESSLPLTVGEIRQLILVFQRAALELKETFIPSLPLELAVVEWCESEKTEKGKEEKMTKVKSEKEEETKEINQKGGMASVISYTEKHESNLTFEDIVKGWKELLTAVRPKNFSIEAFLRAARPIKFDGKFLTVEVFYQFHKDKLESDKCRLVVEAVAGEVYGEPMVIKYLLGKKSLDKLDKKEELSDNTNEPPIVPVAAEAVGGEDIFEVAEKIFNGKEEN